MNASVKMGVTVCLCLISGWLAHSANSQPRNVAAAFLQVASPPNIPARISNELISPIPSTSADSDLAIRRAIARCETNSLWAWIKANPLARRDYLYQVAMELYDRQGDAAINTALAVEDFDERKKLSEIFLEALSSREPWAALEVYKSHRQEFSGEGSKAWGGSAMCSVVGVSCGISAEKLVELLKDLGEHDTPWTFHSDFPPGFDFRVALDYLDTRERCPLGVPDNLAEEWARRSPAEAATWLAEHPNAGVRDKEALSNTIRGVFEATAASTDASRDQALAELGKLPEEIRSAAWAQLGSRNLGKIDPIVLGAADQMGDRNSYLVESLLNTRETETLDPSWSVIPAPDHTALLDAALAKWSLDNETPLAKEIREHWRTTIEKQWASFIR